MDFRHHFGKLHISGPLLVARTVKKCALLPLAAQTVDLFIATFLCTNNETLYQNEVSHTHVTQNVRVVCEEVEVGGFLNTLRTIWDGPMSDKLKSIFKQYSFGQPPPPPRSRSRGSGHPTGGMVGTDLKERNPFNFLAPVQPSSCWGTIKGGQLFHPKFSILQAGKYRFFL